MGIASRLNKILKQSSEIQSWCLVFECFPRIFFILGLFLLFWISFKVLKFSWQGGDLMQILCDFRVKFANVRAGFWLKTSVLEMCNSKTVQTCSYRRLNWLKKNGFLFSKLNLDGDVKIEEKDDVQKEENENDSEDGKFDIVKLRNLVKIEEKDDVQNEENENDSEHGEKDDVHNEENENVIVKLRKLVKIEEKDGQNEENENDSEDGEFDIFKLRKLVKIEETDDVQDKENENDSEDGEFDIVQLRKLVKIERKHKEEALEELEKERMAAASAAEEVMATIHRLHHEKNEIEIRANQFRRMMEEKHQYYQEVIGCLQGIFIMEECELEKSSNEQPWTVGDGTSHFQGDIELILEDDDAQMNNID